MISCDTITFVSFGGHLIHAGCVKPINKDNPMMNRPNFTRHQWVFTWTWTGIHLKRIWYKMMYRKPKHHRKVTLNLWRMFFNILWFAEALEKKKVTTQRHNLSKWWPWMNHSLFTCRGIHTKHPTNVCSLSWWWIGIYLHRSN